MGMTQGLTSGVATASDSNLDDILADPIMVE